MTAIPRPEYPRELEAWWLKFAREKLRVANDTFALRALDAEVAKLSDGFTTERTDGFGDYTNDEKSLIAYGLFFFPQTFVRTLFQFDEISNRCEWKPPASKPLRVCDLGAGTGSAGLAIASRIANGNDVELIAIEKSAASLEIAGRIARESSRLWPRLKFSTRCEDVAGAVKNLDRCDLIVASFSANEAFHGKADAEFDAWIIEILSRLSPGGVLLISEPAMKITSERLERLRDRISAEGKMSIIAPCLHHSACPMLARRGEDFCHEVRWWKPPPSLQSLNSRLFRTIQFLKYSFIAIANVPPELNEGSAELSRLVSPMMEMKGRVQCDGCAADGAIKRYEVLTRSFATKDKHAFIKTERGDVVRWENLSLLGDKATHRAENAAREFGFE